MPSANETWQSSDNRMKYEYSPLASLSLNTKVNVYGVVQHCKPSARCAAAGYYKSLSISDDVLSAAGQKLPITIFAPNERLLPDCYVGDIIRLHRLHVEFYNDMKCAKLQMSSGGAWVVFDGCSNDKMYKSASSTDPSKSEKDDSIVCSLRRWISSGQVRGGTDTPPTSSLITHSPLRSAATNTSGGQLACPSEVLPSNNSCLSNISLDSYACVRCQLVQRSFLVNNMTKVAILTVWDGSRPMVRLNKPDLQGFTTETHECGVVEQLSHLCVPLVVYGDHILRAKQLKLGGLYSFFGVHCKKYPSLELPELYLHERNRTLATPALRQHQDPLVLKLVSATQAEDHVHLDIVADSRSKVELDVELANQRALLSAQPSVTAHPESSHGKTADASASCSNKKEHEVSELRSVGHQTAGGTNLSTGRDNALCVTPCLSPSERKDSSVAQVHNISNDILYCNLELPFVKKRRGNHSCTGTNVFVGEPPDTILNSSSDSETIEILTETPLGHTVMRDTLDITTRYTRAMAVPVVRLHGKVTKPKPTLSARLMKYRYDNHLFEQFVARRIKQCQQICPDIPEDP